MLLDGLQADGKLRLKNNMLEAVVDEAGRINTLNVAGSKKYFSTYSSLLYLKYKTELLLISSNVMICCAGGHTSCDHQ